MTSTRLLAATLAIATTLLTAGAKSSDGWVDVRPSDRSFSVQMPGFPSTDTTVFQDRKRGKVSEYEYILKNDKMFCRVLEAKFEPGRQAGFDHSKTLKDEADTTARAQGSTVVDAKEGSYQGYPARFMVFRRGEYQWKAVSVRAANRSFLLFSGARTAADNRDVERFLRSFRVTL